MQRLPTLGMKGWARSPCHISAIRAQEITTVECQLLRMLQTLQRSAWRARVAFISLELTGEKCVCCSEIEAINVLEKSFGVTVRHPAHWTAVHFQGPRDLLNSQC